MKTRIELGYIHMSRWNNKTSRIFSDWIYREADPNSKDEYYRKLAKEIKETKPNEVILPANTTFTIKIDYPLENPFENTFTTGDKGMTRKQVINNVVKWYRHIYTQERKYGIWGHCLGDLILTTLIVEGNRLRVSCDS